MKNYPDNIRAFDRDPRSPFYQPPCGEDERPCPDCGGGMETTLTEADGDDGKVMHVCPHCGTEEDTCPECGEELGDTAYTVAYGCMNTMDYCPTCHWLGPKLENENE